MASTIQPPSFNILRDFVVGTFSILQHTPVKMLGLNSDRHFDMGSEEAWHSIGRRLAPPGPWEPALEQPGMLSVKMQGARTDGMQGAIRVTVAPSVKVKFGVFVNVNDHYEMEVSERTVPSADAAVAIVRDQWADFLMRSDEIANAIFGASA